MRYPAGILVVRKDLSFPGIELQQPILGPQIDACTAHGFLYNMLYSLLSPFGKRYLPTLHTVLFKHMVDPSADVDYDSISVLVWEDKEAFHRFSAAIDLPEILEKIAAGKKNNK